MQRIPTAVSFDEQLATYKNLLEPSITQFCTRVEQESQEQFGGYSAEAIKVFCSILKRGGKRVRGALVLAAYEMCGGTDLTKVMPIARAMEILQVYLLIADDIYDRSATRRGGPTAHVMMRDMHATHGWLGDSEHFGESIASCATLIGNNLAMEEIAMAPLDDHAKITILRIVNQALRVTDHGQINDLFNEAVRDVDDGHVERTLTWKTAYYSFIGPLQMGAVAAGAPENDLGCLHDYGAHIGLAFQMADDILGTFGSEAESGKSITDDLREGKMTVLVARALRHAAPKQRETLLAYLGKPDLTDVEYQACKAIITQTGALDYAHQLATRQAKQAAQALARAPAHWQAGKLDFLRSLANFVVNRST
jgi:geranylgeranyl pyrophosphate synthase